MPSHDTINQPRYTIWFAGETRRGTAEELLERVRHDAGDRSAEIRKLTTDQYASRIVADAPFFLPEGVLDFLRSEPFPSDHDRALRYLSEMNDSGLRILARSEE